MILARTRSSLSRADTIRQPGLLSAVTPRPDRARAFIQVFRLAFTAGLLALRDRRELPRTPRDRKAGCCERSTPPARSRAHRTSFRPAARRLRRRAPDPCERRV